MQTEHTTTYSSPIGFLIIKCLGDEIVSILFSDYEQTKISETEATSNSLLLNCTKQLDEYFAGERKSFDFPLQQTGTIFQQSVWSKLRDIPFGKTISYLELSKRIGNVKAIRACGTTNGKNKIAIVVPCHRVIGSTNKLVGYAGGLWRKKWLLLHEAKFTVPTETLF